MTAHLVHAAFWLLVLAGQWLRFRPAVRCALAARLGRRWLLTRRTAAAVRRGVTFHPRQPKHAQEHA